MAEEFTSAFQTLLDQVSGWPEKFFSFLPNLILALVILTLAFFVSRWTRHLSYKLYGKFASHQEVASLLARMTSIAMVAILLFLALGVLKLDTMLSSLLAGAGIAGLVIGMAFQGPIGNTISGIILSVRDKYAVGDLVTSNSHLGIIEEINLRNTVIQKLDGEKVVIPNKMVLDSPLENFSISGRRRIVISCGIAYNSDLDLVREVALKAIKEKVEHQEKLPVDFFYTEFGGSSINFILRFWIDKTAQSDFLKSQSDAILWLKKSFDKNGINIPFPIRTLHFDPSEKLNLDLGNQLAPLAENAGE